MRRRPDHLLSVLFAILSLAAPFMAPPSRAEPASAPAESSADSSGALRVEFEERVRPVLERFCYRCHNADRMKSGVRVDHLDGSLPDETAALWRKIGELLANDEMPPEGKPRPSAEERARVGEWVDEALVSILSREAEKNGAVRRLTVAQYRRTLRDLLGIEDDLTDVLPPDAVSKDGFVAQRDTLELSPLLVETYFDIAERALDIAMVDVAAKPAIQNFRVDLGASVNPKPFPDKLILGANSHLLDNADFVVTELSPEKRFDYEPFRMRTKYRFIEGYQGNATVRGWREYDSIYHAVFACMRGTDGYPKGQAYGTVPGGLLLRPAIPNAGLFQVTSTYGPRANFKVSLRELPDHGRFRVTVRAAKYDDGLLLGRPAPPALADVGFPIVLLDVSEPRVIEVVESGVYRVDIDRKATNEQKKAPIVLRLGEREFSGRLASPAFLAVRLPRGRLEVAIDPPGRVGVEKLILTRLAAADATRESFERFELRSPRVGVHVGLRRDCGSTLAPVGAAQVVQSTELADYVFEGAIADFPSPDVEKDNVNYLAGVREIGVRSEYTDGRDRPRLLVRSVEFEGPYYETWPPPSHREIFIESAEQDDPAAYALEILRSFATRAYRRPVRNDELAGLIAVWGGSFAASGNFERSVRDALVVVLTSPQFLFLIEQSRTPEGEPLDPFELASKLSFALWGSAPDRRLLELAESNSLHSGLDDELTRMIADPRFETFADEFATQWLSLGKLDVVDVDRKKFPRLTNEAKSALRREPVELVLYLVRNNLPLRHLVDSDFLMANEIVASYYDLGDRTDSGFEFVPIRHDDPNLGGLLSSAGVLAALSDGRESNPVKRGAWLARKIVAEPPDDPPPNVPELADDTQLTLRERLEKHRDVEGCRKCHQGIDPWGIPLESFDAGGRFVSKGPDETRSTLPDGTQVADARALKDYLVRERIDQVAFSLFKHFATFATGRTLTYSELEFLRTEGKSLSSGGYRMQDMLRFVLHSELFLEK